MEPNSTIKKKGRPKNPNGRKTHSVWANDHEIELLNIAKGLAPERFDRLVKFARNNCRYKGETE